MFAEEPFDSVELGSGQIHDLAEKIALFEESLTRQLNECYRAIYANNFAIARTPDPIKAESYREAVKKHTSRSVDLRSVQASMVLQSLKSGVEQGRTKFRGYYLRSFDELYQRYYDFVVLGV